MKKKTKNNLLLVGLLVVLVVVGLSFIYMGWNYLQLAEEYTALATQFAKLGTHPGLVLFDQNMAASNHTHGSVAIIIGGIIISIAGIIIYLIRTEKS